MSWSCELKSMIDISPELGQIILTNVEKVEAQTDFSKEEKLTTERNILFDNLVKVGVEESKAKRFLSITAVSLNNFLDQLRRALEKAPQAEVKICSEPKKIMYEGDCYKSTHCEISRYSLVLCMNGEGEDFEVEVSANMFGVGEENPREFFRRWRCKPKNKEEE